MKKYGLESPYSEKHSAKGGIERETLEELVEQGMTIAEIAQEVGLSKGTVRHWLKRYGLKTKNGRGTRQRGIAASGKAAGRRTITMTCIRHGDTDFVIEGRGYYRCKQCRVERVVERRRKVKRILVEEAGGKCRICGYDRCIGALEFHHIDPTQKRLALSYGGHAHAIATLRAEAAKCVLLCSNCHVEVEAGVTVLPATVLPTPAQDLWPEIR